MKLSQYAKRQGPSYHTALSWYHDGSINGYQVAQAVNDNRLKLLSLLTDAAITLPVVEQKDLLKHFGYRSIETLLEL